MQTLEEYLINNLSLSKMTPSVIERFKERLKEGKLTRDENPESHCCAVVLPYDPISKKLFLVDHIKAGTWIFPGGHIDSGENPKETIVREIKEELGVGPEEYSLTEPFFLRVLDINNPKRPCREHYDIFFGISVDPEKIKIDPSEFNDSGWFSFSDARKQIKVQQYIESIDWFEKFLKNVDSK